MPQFWKLFQTFACLTPTRHDITWNMQKVAKHVRTYRMSERFKLPIQIVTSLIMQRARTSWNLRVSITNWSFKSLSQEMFDTKWLEVIIFKQKPHTLKLIRKRFYNTNVVCIFNNLIHLNKFCLYKIGSIP
jgi:hypothetical protein